MSDFEVHERGTIEELRLSRALCEAIRIEIEGYGQVVPSAVFTAYNRLVAHHETQLHKEEV
jgi:hypothetical protein